MCEKMETEIRFIEFGSAEYGEELKLRDLILRRPLGLVLAEEELKGEDSQFHIGAFRDEKLVGCMVLTPREERKIQVRQVAVLEELQGSGIGKELMLFAEEYIKENRYSLIILQARTVVEGFYKKLGYERVGDVFIAKNIPHVKMQKEL